MKKEQIIKEYSEIIDQFSESAKEYLNIAESRSISPDHDALKNLSGFDRELQDEPVDPKRVLNELHSLGSPATVLNTGGRFFGFVIGGTLPVALGANLMAGVWDQNAGLEVASPVSAALEKISRKWLVRIFNLPPETQVGFVTGATMANFTALASARHAVLAKEGWNVEENGLYGAPPLTVVVSEEAHVSLFKALSHLGLGRNRVVKIPCDDQGRMRPDRFPVIHGPAIVCLQAGNIHTGSFDPAGQLCDIAHQYNAWVHVDGAFGLWAMTLPEKHHLTAGLEKADSWATDAHKWLNTPYDSGLAFVKDANSLTAAMTQNASYLIQDGSRDPSIYVPEMSRRARGTEIWAALRGLGRNGLTGMIRNSCDAALLFSEKLKNAGFEILNDVVLNQVMVSFGSDELNAKVIHRIQEEGTCWCGGTKWHDRSPMRISISSWRTTSEDVERCVQIMIATAKEEINKMVMNAGEPVRTKV